jgi:hypothetical protein
MIWHDHVATHRDIVFRTRSDCEVCQYGIYRIRCQESSASMRAECDKEHKIVGKDASESRWELWIISLVGSDTDLTQSIATSPGQLYNVSFWLESPGGTPNDFSASFAGVTFYTVTNAGAFPYTQFSMDITATSTSSLLDFAARQDPSYWHLDDVDAHAVPEPGTLGLIALGAFGLMGALRKRLA